MYAEIDTIILTNISYTISSLKNRLDTCTKNDDRKTYFPNFNFSFSYSTTLCFGLNINVITTKTNEVNK